ncbi:GtrA family protein [Helicobacter sp. MIT 99-5507]|uniref:GtrA family protein n=1 Tax=Helicobacter sp. MIT 99-5507 TaxID=152489 RepID=UPI000E1EE724|nr:GtrA family protein [Helicobacter sp. MIT 99-5507]RDU56684.1 GtrA family protein [Helicobacter sp. MIT 99-5507]
MIKDSKFVRYLIIGVFNTAIGYGIIFILMAFLVIPEIANIIGYIIGIIISYVLNKIYTFRTKTKSKKEFFRFVICMICSYLINFIVLVILYRNFGVDKYIATIIASVFYTISGYIFSKYFAFKN